MLENESADSGMDMNAAAANVASSLFGNTVEPVRDEPEPEIEQEASESDVEPLEQEVAETEEVAPVVVRPAPQSWAKDKHEAWAKTDPAAQEYIELREKQMLDGLEAYKGDANYGKQLKEVLAPYRPMLAAQGVNEAQAVSYLLNANYKLTSGSMEDRQRAYQELGESLGFHQPVEQGEVDPAVRALQEKISRLESGLTERQQQEQQREHLAQQEARGRIDSEVQAFASDPAHPYFDEVADHIVAMLKTGATLKDAYEQAVWANPVTRQKEMARTQTENEQKLKAKAKADAEAARKASSSNIRSRDTKQAPTESIGTMEDTVKAALKDIRSRTH